MAKKAKKGWHGKLPFDVQSGRLLSWTRNETYDPVKREMVPFNDPRVEWRDNVVFEDTVTFDHISHGRSSVTMEVKSSKTPGLTYSIFLSDVQLIIPLMDRGVYKGKFTYCKRGQNYATMPLLDSEAPKA